MKIEWFATLTLFVLAFYGSPGPATLSCAQSGASFGFQRSIPYVFGIVIGLGINFLLAASGVAVLLEASPSATAWMRALSLLYIVFLAVRMVRSPLNVDADHELRPLTAQQGILLNVLNPKAYFGALAVLAQFGTGDSIGMAILFTIVVTMGLIIDLGWCYGGVLLGRSISSSRAQRQLRIVLALLMVGSAALATFGGS